MSFSKDFVWGVSTSAFQIEGAYLHDGKGRSVWDDFCDTPKKVFGGHTGAVACDHFNRFKEDIKLMAQLGIKNYRFSISWPRVMPQGTGAVNKNGLRFYSELVDCLLENGITPFVTLFHWDLPSELIKRGGFANPESPNWFAEYTRVVALELGDRVKNFMPLNEPQCFIGLGYVNGHHAPGLKLSLLETIPMAHNVLLANSKSINVLKEIVDGVKVSYAPCKSVYCPATDSPEDIEAARKKYFSVDFDSTNWAMNVAWWSDPVLLGEYPSEALKIAEKYLPAGYEKDMDKIKTPLDYYGQNIYDGIFVSAKNGVVPHNVGHPKTALNWPVVPESLYWGPKFLYERYKTPILITENGMSAHDAVSLDGFVHDPNREDYLHRYLLEYKRCAADGVPLHGYFQWSFMDNFEWSEGYNERFGLVYVDYKTQKRIPKDSAYWYKKVMETNGSEL